MPSVIVYDGEWSEPVNSDAATTRVNAEGDRDRCDVVVVGAGITGLTAADALTRAGASVTVFEARDRVGGRAHSVMTNAGRVDLGATWFWPNEPFTQALSSELGLGNFPQQLSGDALFAAEKSSGFGTRRLSGNPIDVPSCRFVEGAQVLAEKLSDRLATGALQLGDPVSALSLEQDGVQVTACSARLLANYVIVAIPPALAVEQITFTPGLPEGVRVTAESTAVWMGSMVKTVAVYDRAFWREDGLSGAAISYAGPFREFHDHSGPDGEPAAIFGFAPADSLAGLGPQSVETIFIEQLMNLFGPAAAGFSEVHLQDWSQEAYTMPEALQPGASTASYGAAEFQHPVGDRIYLASTETAPVYAGHIEGAIRVGKTAARRVHAQLVSKQSTIGD